MFEYFVLPLRFERRTHSLGVIPRLALGFPTWRRALCLYHAVRFGGQIRMKAVALSTELREHSFRTPGGIQTPKSFHP